MVKEPAIPTKDNALARALARWEWESGRIESDGEEHAALIREEEHILQSQRNATHG
jgi:hypothetical protein